MFLTLICLLLVCDVVEGSAYNRLILTQTQIKAVEHML